MRELADALERRDAGRRLLLATGESRWGGALYRVTGATGASPTVTKVTDLPGEVCAQAGAAR